MNKVLVSGFVLNSNEKKELKDNLFFQGTEFLVVDELGIVTFSAETITILFALSEALAQAAVYDIMKYSLQKVISYLGIIRNKHQIPDEKKTKIIITKNGKTEIMEFNFILTEEQKDKVIDATILKFKDV